MSLYDPPKYNNTGTYNEFDYSNNIVDATTIDTTVFVHKSGDSMVGGLNVPSLNIYDINGSLEFPKQTTAFTQAYIDKINGFTDTTHLITFFKILQTNIKCTNTTK